MKLKEEQGRELMMERAKELFIAFDQVTNLCPTIMEKGKGLDDFSQGMAFGKAIQKLDKIGKKPPQLDDFIEAMSLSGNKQDVVGKMSLVELHGEIVQVKKDLAKTLLGVSGVNDEDVQFLSNKYAAEAKQNQDALTRQAALAEAVKELAHKINQTSL